MMAIEATIREFITDSVIGEAEYQSNGISPSPQEGSENQHFVRFFRQLLQVRKRLSLYAFHK